MIRLLPNTLTGPRAYFTGFDHRIVARSGSREGEIQRQVERRLKLLLMTKSVVVCAASHLKSPVAVRIFQQCPELLSQKHILPALRDDKHSLAAEFRENADLAKFYDGIVVAAVNWNLAENSAWFREKFLAELTSTESVVNRNISPSGAAAVAELSGRIQKMTMLDRQVIENTAATLSEHDRLLLLAYRDLVYHISGARVVGCEGVLPQEEYMEVDVAAPTQHRPRLTEAEMLWKFVVELVLDSLQRELLPIDMLDQITFKDVIAMRQPLSESHFRASYDDLIRSTMTGFSNENNGRVVLDVDQLAAVHGKLRETFQLVVAKEVPDWLRRKRRASNLRMFTSSVLVVTNLIEFPGTLGLISNLANKSEAAISWLLNVNGVRGRNDVAGYLAAKQSKAKELAVEADFDDRTLLVDFVEYLTSVLAERIRL